jgi:opacity protein-like surface antigen
VDETVPASGTLPIIGKVTGALAPAVVMQQYNVSHGLNLLLANFVLQSELTARLNLAFRTGVGVTIPHPEIRAFGQALDQYERHGVALQLAGGVQFNLTPRLYWLGEYKFTHTKPRFEPGSASIENSFATHHVVTGLGLRF